MLDLEPHGPLPRQIYWRRRALALGIAALVIGIVVAVVAVVVMNSTSNEQPTANESAAPAAEAVPPPLPGENPEVKSPIQPPAQQAPPPTPTPTAAVVPPPILKEGDDCPDSTLAVKGITNQPQYVVGDQPKFTMVVTNIGLVACQRDVGAAVLAAYVYSLDNQRLWSNLDCAPSNETLIKTFQPGEQVTTEVTWTGMGSAPNCPLPRQPIGPGTYNLVVQLGNLRSATVPFILAQPAQAPPPAPADGAPHLPVPGPVG
ncbi:MULTISPECIES: hypothetical protein [Mycolicibacterium]|uniref:Uncharacterized protein n=2 Tax=Mycolicibacterium TaxID=1866885 RepID=A1TG15_MYCVP|nr:MULTISPECIES: hypothetical protein [Mycolicibacterium]ABM16115.1 conserved hypothetical protein [Mycolicibacterium vanbaalenii PYR-1]MCV7129597.1 hypothetical protein [Mycolicibacterium vanbaalenii PYR-1]MDN4516833.1 hypothetical protein [Mycolicibacterium austroafricanum]MDW5611663.1 hypothetical protein [Mycolicibacterium sp. D5.8-2]QRZ06443.1 hypothetical protein JN090_26770 [Mycolicibacterium austroafricanum]